MVVNDDNPYVQLTNEWNSSFHIMVYDWGCSRYGKNKENIDWQVSSRIDGTRLYFRKGFKFDETELKLILL